MQSVFGDKKPVCLILDEVDGLTTDAVDELVKIVKVRRRLWLCLFCVFVSVVPRAAVVCVPRLSCFQSRVFL